MRPLYKETCTVRIEKYPSHITDMEQLQTPLSLKTFSGDKNKVFQRAKNYLKSESFHRPILSDVMNTINKTCVLRLGKYVCQGSYDSTSCINNEKGFVYIITVRYVVYQSLTTKEN